MPSKKGTRTPHYGDPEFKGNGILVCHNCGLPTRDHPLRPCDRKPINAIAVIPLDGKLPRKTRPREGLDK